MCSAIIIECVLHLMRCLMLRRHYECCVAQAKSHPNNLQPPARVVTGDDVDTLRINHTAYCFCEKLAFPVSLSIWVIRLLKCDPQNRWCVRVCREWEK